MDTLPVTDDKNDRGEDSNTNEIIENVLTSNYYLNDKKIICLQRLRLNAGVDIDEIKVR